MKLQNSRQKKSRRQPEITGWYHTDQKNNPYSEEIQAIMKKAIAAPEKLSDEEKAVAMAVIVTEHTKRLKKLNKTSTLKKEIIKASREIVSPY